MVGFFQRVYVDEPAIDEDEEGKEEQVVEKDFSIVKNLLNTCNDKSSKPNRGEDLLFQFFNTIFDKEESVIEKHLADCIKDLSRQNILDQKAFTAAVSRFLWLINDMVSDVPKLPYLFSTFVLVPLLQVNKINLAEVKWTDPSDEDGDEFLMFDAFYQVGACIAQHFYEQTKSWEAAEKAF